jgi:hypothetical protein
MPSLFSKPVKSPLSDRIKAMLMISQVVSCLVYIVLENGISRKLNESEIENWYFNESEMK